MAEKRYVVARGDLQQIADAANLSNRVVEFVQAVGPRVGSTQYEALLASIEESDVARLVSMLSDADQDEE